MPKEKLNSGNTRLVDEWDEFSPNDDPQHFVGIRFWSMDDDSAILSGIKVTNQQRFLAQLGYDLGPSGVDGKPGPCLNKAIFEYQEFLKDYGYSGKPDGIWMSKTQEAHENFLRTKPHQIIESDHVLHLEDAPTVHLGWTGESNGKEGSFTSDTPDLARVQFHVEISEEEILRKADEIRTARKKSENSGGQTSYTGVWYSRTSIFSTTVLSRADLNRAIKTIRRARDAVFGSDE